MPLFLTKASEGALVVGVVEPPLCDCQVEVRCVRQVFVAQVDDAEERLTLPPGRIRQLKRLQKNSTQFNGNLHYRQTAVKRK
jgi:hypothetical protein